MQKSTSWRNRKGKDKAQLTSQIIFCQAQVKEDHLNNLFSMKKAIDSNYSQMKKKDKYQ